MRLLTNSGGSVAGQASYTPFGEVMASSTADSVFGFAGEQTDETGLQYLRARYYAPEQGRFLTIDPFVGRQPIPYSLHPYQYGYSNPVRYIDPSGEEGVCGGLAAAAALASGGTAAVPVFGVCEAAVVTAAAGVVCFSSGACQAAGEAVVEGAVGITNAVVDTVVDVVDYFSPQPEELVPEVEIFPLDVGIELPTYTPPVLVDNWWQDDGEVLSTPINDAVELSPEGFSVEIPSIELEVFPLSQEQQELICTITPSRRPLTRLHADETLRESTLEYWRRQRTDDIIESLLSDGKHLTIRPDGTVVDGNHRIKVLEERGYDTSKLYDRAHVEPKISIDDFFR